MTLTVDPAHIARQAAKAGQRDEDLAVEVAKLAVEHCKNHGIATPDGLTDVCEWLWLWVVSDSATAAPMWGAPADFQAGQEIG